MRGGEVLPRDTSYKSRGVLFVVSKRENSPSSEILEQLLDVRRVEGLLLPAAALKTAVVGTSAVVQVPRGPHSRPGPHFSLSPRHGVSRATLSLIFDFPKKEEILF